MVRSNGGPYSWPRCSWNLTAKQIGMGPGVTSKKKMSSVNSIFELKLLSGRNACSPNGPMLAAIAVSKVDISCCYKAWLITCSGHQSCVQVNGDDGPLKIDLVQGIFTLPEAHKHTAGHTRMCWFFQCTMPNSTRHGLSKHVKSISSWSSLSFGCATLLLLSGPSNAFLKLRPKSGGRDLANTVAPSDRRNYTGWVCWSRTTYFWYCQKRGPSSISKSQMPLTNLDLLAFGNTMYVPIYLSVYHLSFFLSLSLSLCTSKCGICV